MYWAEALSVFAVIISIMAIAKPIRHSTRNIYFQQFNLRLDMLSAELSAYSAKEENEQKCQHYLELISRQRTNHINNKDKQDNITMYCREIRRLLPSISSKQTLEDKNNALKDIYEKVRLIEVDINDFCYK